MPVTARSGCGGCNARPSGVNPQVSSLSCHASAALQAVGEHNYAAWSVRVMAGKFQYVRNNLVACLALIADMKAIRQGAPRM